MAITTLTVVDSGWQRQKYGSEKRKVDFKIFGGNIVLAFTVDGHAQIFGCALLKHKYLWDL